MKPDLYTKVVLTTIAILLGVIAFEYRPVKPAHAFGDPDHIACPGPQGCWMFEGDRATLFNITDGANNSVTIWNWKTGKKISR